MKNQLITVKPFGAIPWEVRSVGYHMITKKIEDGPLSNLPRRDSALTEKARELNG